jgi:hypothetical protein
MPEIVAARTAAIGWLGPLTDIIVAKIIEHAKAGETDPDLLCARVLLELENQANSNGK